MYYFIEYYRRVVSFTERAVVDKVHGTLSTDSLRGVRFALHGREKVRVTLKPQNLELLVLDDGRMDVPFLEHLSKMYPEMKGTF